MKQYNNTIEDQVKKGIIEKIDDNIVEGEVKHYIPHHGVIKPNNLTTKLRIVYDASAKRTGSRSHKISVAERHEQTSHSKQY